MRPLDFVGVLCTLILLRTVSAWPWQLHGTEMRNDLEKRQDTIAANTASTAAALSTAMITAPAATATATGMASSHVSGTDTKTNRDTAGTITGTRMRTRTGTGTATATGTGTGDFTTTATSSIYVDPRLPAGGASMIDPGPFETTYYRIGQQVTFVWNYTSLLVTPSAVNVIASCSLNDATYTISSNMSVKQTGSVVWDTGEYQATATVPLLTATYTLIIYDESEPINYIAPAGHLSPQNQLRFGMYIPQPYTPLNEFKCATCSSAFSDLDRIAVKFALAMIGVTLTSFAIFASDFGAFAS